MNKARVTDSQSNSCLFKVDGQVIDNIKVAVFTFATSSFTSFISFQNLRVVNSFIIVVEEELSMEKKVINFVVSFHLLEFHSF